VNFVIREQSPCGPAFEVHRRLIGDYRDFTEGFFKVRDPRVGEVLPRLQHVVTRE
jgi:hypothetical protein